LIGVGLCGAAGRAREAGVGRRENSWLGFLFAMGAGIISAIFNIGYALALPIADAGEKLGHKRFLATNVIWLLMLGAGAIPNVLYCGYLIRRHHSGGLFTAQSWQRAWSLSMLMGLLWGGSIFLYGAATPLLGPLGPPVGWPLSLAVALVVANTMGFLLDEWKSAPPRAVRGMRLGTATMLAAVFLCALSANSK
jgi:L-rhamnose-H+ transport protein